MSAVPRLAPEEYARRVTSSHATAQADAWVCTDCLMAIEGYGEHETGRRLPVPFEHDPTVLHVIAGLTECHHFERRDWSLWPDEWHDEHKEDCETREFSHALCAGCRSPWAGTRHAVTIVTADVQQVNTGQ